MEASESRRLAALPGYDTAPDIYETPDYPTDDTSTTALTAPSSAASDTSADEDTFSNGESGDDARGYGLSRRRLYPARARNMFGAASRGVDAKGVDLSDRVDGRRKGYKVRRGGRDDGDEEEEGLEARIARLRREIEECRLEAERDGHGQDGEDNAEGGAINEVDGLRRLLAAVEVPPPSTGQRVGGKEGKTEVSEDSATGDEPLSDEQTLQKVADFDSRLASLEQALGISSLDAVTHDSVSAPVLPSLAVLDQQFTALTAASSLSGLDAASSRIAKLRRDADELAAAHNTVQSATPSDESSLSDGAATPIAAMSPDDLQRLQALYALLPTLQSLTPTVPAMLNRLRSLRSLHASAATAASELDEVEKRQTEMEKELSTWREGLEKVEEAVKQASESNGQNGVVVEGWVKDLEGRIKTLGR